MRSIFLANRREGGALSDRTIAPAEDRIADRGVGATKPVDSFGRLLWWLFSSSAGARTRAEIVRAVREEPRNAQQLARSLNLDYTTVRHHLRVLGSNHLIESSGPHYGQVYVLSATLEARWTDLEQILARQRKS